MKKPTELRERLAGLFGGRRRTNAEREIKHGIALIEQGDHASAIATLNKVLADNPQSTSALLNLGAALVLSGDPDQAIEVFDQTLAIDAQCWPALVNASRIRIERKRAAEAADFFRKAGSIVSLPVDVVMVYARCLIDMRNFSDAHALLRSSKHRLNSSAEFWLLYGVTCQFLGLSNDAEAAFRAVRSFGPTEYDIESRHGRLLADCGEYGQARNTLARHTALGKPTEDAHIAYARALEIFGERPTAIRIYKKILGSTPNHVEALTNLGNLTKQDVDYVQSESLHRRALNLQNNSTTIRRNLADLLGKTFRTEEAIAELRRCVELSPNNPYALSDYIFSQHYSANLSAKELRETAETWGLRHGGKRLQSGPLIRPDSDRPLRIGLLSGRFFKHPVGFLALPGLESLDRSRFSITCYANQSDCDSYTRRFRSLSDRWRSVAHLSDQHLVTLIREDRIDILIEMAGHAAGHRLPVVAHRVAPLQIKWIGGQFNTMGIDTIDYFLSDPIESPPEHDDLYFERIHRLPTVYACYEPPADAPDVSPLPAHTKHHITFGSLNKLNKVGPKTVALWSRCLEAVPNSRLVLQSEPFDDEKKRRPRPRAVCGTRSRSVTHFLPRLFAPP